MESCGVYSFVWFPSLSMMFTGMFVSCRELQFVHSSLPFSFRGMNVPRGGCLLHSAWTLGCFHLETIIIRAAMNILAYVFLLVTIWAHFCWVYPRCGNSGSWNMHMVRCSRSYCLSKVVVLIYISTKNVWKLWFLHLLTTPYQFVTPPAPLLLPLSYPCTAMQASEKHSMNL